MRYNLSMHLANLRSSIRHLQTFKPMTWTNWTTNSVTDRRKRIVDGITPEDTYTKTTHTRLREHTFKTKA